MALGCDCSWLLAFLPAAGHCPVGGGTLSLNCDALDRDRHMIILYLEALSTLVTAEAYASLLVQI